MSAKPLSKATLMLLNIALAVATFMIVLDYSIANVSIPYIAGDLGVSYDQGTYVITAFAVGNGIVLAISGWLTKRIGGAKLLIYSLLLFVFFSWLCGAAWNFSVLVVARFLQGAVAGPLIPLSQTLILKHNPPEKKNAVMAFWSMVVIVGPVVGPILGGWLTFDYKWPWIFFINVPIGIVAAFCIWRIIGKEKEEIEKVPLEVVGLILLIVGVSCLQIFLDKGQQYDWFRSPAMRFFGATAFLCLTFLVVWEVMHPRPLLDLRLARIRTYWISLVSIAVAYAMYFGSVVLVPLWLQSNMGYTSPWAGIAVAPIGIAPVLFTIFVERVINKFGRIIPLCFSFIAFAISCFYTAYFTTDVDIYHVAFSRFLLGFGFIFFITPLIGLSLQGVPQDRLANAASIFHFIRAIFGGIGTSIFTTMWLRRTYYHHERLGSALTEYTPNSIEFLKDVAQVGITGEPATELLNLTVDNQAALLSINDCFFAMGWGFLALCLMLLLVRKSASSSTSSHETPTIAAH
ncbi:MAG: DHA2 family efflux MFS transporter permease subunit [Chlamydiales bacterium]|nr:DHA2 family efflux MFS transporter permease subunit [Chlamydiales bacterium]